MTRVPKMKLAQGSSPVKTAPIKEINDPPAFVRLQAYDTIDGYSNSNFVDS